MSSLHFIQCTSLKAGGPLRPSSLPHCPLPASHHLPWSPRVCFLFSTPTPALCQAALLACLHPWTLQADRHPHRAVEVGHRALFRLVY